MSEIPDMCKKLKTLALTCLLKPGTPDKLICRHFKAIQSNPEYMFNSRVGYKGLQWALGVENHPFGCSCNSLAQVL